VSAIGEETLALLTRLAWVALAILFAEAVGHAHAAARDGRLSGGIAFALELGAWSGAAALLASLVARPGPDLAATAAGPRALAFAALAGAAIRRLSPLARATAVAAVSALVVGRVAGAAALAASLSACLPAYALVRHMAPRRPRLAALLQVALFATLLGVLAHLRTRDGITALAAFGLLAFVGMRHASFALATRSSPPASLAQYLAYLLFYPTCLGAMEVFDEFRDKNLRGDSVQAPAEALGRIALGAVALTIALQIDASMDRVTATAGALAAWGEVSRLFVRASLAVSGLWGMLEGGALLLGFRLRPNFRRILLAESPREFWHAWRGTMTRWLTVHVYVPLGGGRRHRMRNTAAAFAVSTAWHCLGVAMLLGERVTPASFAPVAAWGAFSFAGVAVHAAVRARRAPRDRALPAALAVRALKIGGTWIYGSFTVTLLDLSLGDPQRFALFLRRITGLG